MNRAPTRIEPLFCTQERGWYAEVYDRRANLIHTTKVRPSKAESITSAKEWLAWRKKGNVQA